MRPNVRFAHLELHGKTLKMSLKPPPNYLAGYAPHLTEQVHNLIHQGRFGEVLLAKYPETHSIRTDKALYEYVTALKNSYLRKAPAFNRVVFDSKLHLTHKALGTHTRKSAVHGAKLKAKKEMHIASLFKEVPLAFLRMIVVHELAHTREQEHNKAFYQMCLHMEPNYHQLEFDLRAYLVYLEHTDAGLWTR